MKEVEFELPLVELEDAVDRMKDESLPVLSIYLGFHDGEKIILKVRA